MPIPILYLTRRAGGAVAAARFFAWGSVAAVSAFLLNNYLSNWRDWPGPSAIFGDGSSGLAWVQAGLYAACLAAAAAYIGATPSRRLRPDAERIYAITAYIIRAAFWAVLLIGFADAAISFLRVEGLLPHVVGAELATELGRARTRGIYVHFPLAGAALGVAALTRTLGFHWLGLLVAGAELAIVVTRFVFSYEQAFMSDLVRFWYAALFLFASAYTLIGEGHVRVDVLYSLFPERRRGLVNAIGTALLGMPLCWVTLVYGMRLVPQGSVKGVEDARLTLADGASAGLTLHTLDGTIRPAREAARCSRARCPFRCRR